MPVCSIVRLLSLGTVDDLMHYCTRPPASCIRSSTAPRGNSFDYTTNRHEITVFFTTTRHIMTIIQTVIVQFLRFPGIFSTCALFGPTIATLLGGVFSKLPVDLKGLFFLALCIG